VRVGASVLGVAVVVCGGSGVGRAVLGEGALDFCDGSGSADKGRGWEVSKAWLEAHVRGMNSEHGGLLTGPALSAFSAFYRVAYSQLGAGNVGLTAAYAVLKR